MSDCWDPRHPCSSAVIPTPKTFSLWWRLSVMKCMNVFVFKRSTGSSALLQDTLERKSQEDRDGESRAASASDQKAHVPRRPHASGDATQKIGMEASLLLSLQLLSGGGSRASYCTSAGAHDRQEAKKAKTSPAASKKPSVEQIRRNVRDSLKDILLKR